MKESTNSSTTSSSTSVTADCEVDEIVGKRVYQEKIQYQVLWKGYSETHNSWLNEDRCEHCKDAIEDFNNKSIE